MEHNTHAPWRVVQNWHGKLAVVDARNDGQHTNTGRVCNLPQGRDFRGIAMARLIAAAPDLLAALRALVDAPMFDDLAPHIAAARAAIAKAEGGE